MKFQHKGNLCSLFFILCFSVLLFWIPMAPSLGFSKGGAWAHFFLVFFSLLCCFWAQVGAIAKL
jgi:hypothetical protein